MKRTPAIATVASFVTFPTAFITMAAPHAQPKRSMLAPAMQHPAQTQSAQRSNRRTQNNSLSKNTPQGVFFVFGLKRSALSIPYPLFLFERKRGKKNQKTCRFIALSVRKIIQKSAPLPARDVRPFLANIRRNREAKEGFTGSLCSSNAL